MKTNNKNILFFALFAITAACALVILINKYPLTSGISPNQIHKNTTISKTCIVGGCNNEICIENSKKSDDITSICLYSPTFECYKNAECKVQEDGKCGWTQTETLRKCFEEKKNEIPR